MPRTVAAATQWLGPVEAPRHAISEAARALGLGGPGSRAVQTISGPDHKVDDDARNVSALAHVALDRPGRRVAAGTGAARTAAPSTAASAGAPGARPWAMKGGVGPIGHHRRRPAPPAIGQGMQGMQGQHGPQGQLGMQGQLGFQALQANQGQQGFQGTQGF